MRVKASIEPRVMLRPPSISIVRLPSSTRKCSSKSGFRCQGKVPVATARRRQLPFTRATSMFVRSPMNVLAASRRSTLSLSFRG